MPFLPVVINVQGTYYIELYTIAFYRPMIYLQLLQVFKSSNLWVYFSLQYYLVP